MNFKEWETLIFNVIITGFRQLSFYSLTNGCILF